MDTETNEPIDILIDWSKCNVGQVINDDQSDDAQLTDHAQLYEEFYPNEEDHLYVDASFPAPVTVEIYSRLFTFYIVDFD